MGHHLCNLRHLILHPISCLQLRHGQQYWQRRHPITFHIVPLVPLWSPPMKKQNSLAYTLKHHLSPPTVAQVYNRHIPHFFKPQHESTYNWPGSPLLLQTIQSTMGSLLAIGHKVICHLIGLPLQLALVSLQPTTISLLTISY